MRLLLPIQKYIVVLIMLLIGLNQAIAESKLQTTLQKNLPDRQVLSIAATPLQGIFEVVLDGKQIIYTNVDASYVLVGHLINLMTKQNLTEKKMETLNVVNFSAFPLNQAIKEVRGTGARKLLVFSDPDCFYCKQLEQKSLKGLDNITIYTFLFPLRMHTDASRKARLIWCAKNPTAAWQQWIMEGKLPNESSKCSDPLPTIAKIAERFNITSTPTLIFENGQLVSGALTQPMIEKYLNAASTTQNK